MKSVKTLSVLVVVLLVNLPSLIFCQDSQSKLQNAASDAFAQSTVRLRLQHIEESIISIGHGAAFGVDLSEYGIHEPRYLLSAAHLVLAKDGAGLASGDLRVELSGNKTKEKSWRGCEVVAVDEANDLCLLKTNYDLNTLSRLAPDDKALVGQALTVVGCPRGVPPCVSNGTLVDKYPNVNGHLWEASAKFDHGNSGGPVFDASKGTVMGVAVAGVKGETGDMDPNVALFVPASNVRKFLRDALEKKYTAEIKPREKSAPPLILGSSYNLLSNLQR